MTIYRDRLSGEIKTKADILNQYSNISVPIESEWNSNVYNALNIDPVVEVEPPLNDNIFKVVRYAGEEKDISGVYYQKWKISNRFIEYVDEDDNTITRQQQESEYKAQLDNAEINKNRFIRNRLISETDWWAKVDTTLTDERAAYRQALRDITNHENWPYLQEEDWPVKPV
jgi:hypothetical protein